MFILGEALEPIWERLSDAILFHDIGCRYGDCLHRLQGDEMTDMWAMLASFHDATALGKQVDKFNADTSFIAIEWQQVWSIMLKNHQRLEGAVLAAYGTPSAPYSASLLVTTPATRTPTATATSAALNRITCHLLVSGRAGGAGQRDDA